MATPPPIIVSPISATTVISAVGECRSLNHTLLSLPMVTKCDVTVKNIPHKCLKRNIMLISAFSEIITIKELAKIRTVTIKIMIKAKRISGSLKILNFCISLISRMNNDFDNAKTKNNKITPSTRKILVALSFVTSKPEVDITDIDIKTALKAGTPARVKKSHKKIVIAM